MPAVSIEGGCYYAYPVVKFHHAQFQKQKRLSDVGNEQKRQGNEETGESRVLLVSKLSVPRASDGYTGNFVKNAT